MGNRKRNDQGRYADGIAPETVLEVFDEREDPARPVTAGDVVDELGIARRTAHNKLNRLVERGVLDTRKVGAKGRVWWQPIRQESIKSDTRTEVLRRDGFACQICGAAGKDAELEVHHQTPISEGGTDNPENLITVCVDCHSREHRDVADEEIIVAVNEHYPAATSEVAGELELSRQAVDYRLHRLRDEGRVNSKKIGASLVWFTPEQPATNPPEEPGDGPEDAVDRTATSAGGGTDTIGSRDTLGDVVEAIAEGWDDDERLEARKSAARAVLDHAREHGEVSQKEAKEEIYPEYPVEGQSPRTWYRKNIRPVLNKAAEYDESERAYQLVADLDT